MPSGAVPAPVARSLVHVASRAERSLSFGAVAGDYDRLRPSPPPEAVDWLLPDRRDIVVDLAAGTGLLTRALAGKVRHVIAVEPDERMRSVLHARSADVEVLAGRGESIPLPDASADGVFVSSAWHWMDPSLAVPEIARVLRDGGRFGVIWTGRRHDIPWLHGDEWFSEAHAEARGHRESSAGPEASRAEPTERSWRQQLSWYEEPEAEGTDEVRADERIPDRERRQVRLPDRTLFDNIETTVFRFSRSMPVADVVDMLATYSGIITASPEARAAGRARAAAALAAEFPSVAELEVPMRSRCWRADRTSRATGSTPQDH
jgi:SAM-dependent methyltransferase